MAVLLFLAVPVAWASFFLTRARRRWPIVVSSLLAVEAGLHAGLSLLTGPVTQVATMQFAARGQMAMGADAMPVSRHAMPMPPAGGLAAMPLVPSFAMVAAHLVATVLTGAVLAYGEHLLWCLWAWLHRAVVVSAVLVQVAMPREVTPSWLLTVSPVPVRVNRTIRRRGPPGVRLGLSAPA